MCLFILLIVCRFACLCACRFACLHKSEKRHNIDPHGAPNRCKIDPKSAPGPPKWLRNRPRDDPNRSKIAPWGASGGALGRSWDFVRNGRVQRSTGDLGKSTFRTSKDPKGAKRAPKAIYRLAPAPPKTALGRFLTPQNDERKKQRGHFWGLLGPDVCFPRGKTAIAKMALRAPMVLSEGPSGPSVAHLAPFRDLGGSPGPPVSALGVPRDPSKSAQKNLKRHSGPTRGANLRISQVRMHSAKKRKKTNTKNRCVQNLVRRSFSEGSKIDFLAARRVPEARFKNSYRQKWASKSQNCTFGFGKTTFREKKLESLKIVTFGARGVLKEPSKKIKTDYRGKKNRHRRPNVP